MDNQQETLTAYIAGLMDGEGCFVLYRIQHRRRYQYRGYIGFTNTDPPVVQRVIDYCVLHEIRYHVNTDIRAHGHKICYNLYITAQEDRIRFTELLLPWLTGQKAAEATLLRDFLVERRLHRPTRSTPDSLVAISIYEQYKKLKGPSETTRGTPHVFKQRNSKHPQEDEDIVHAPVKAAA